MRDYISRQDAIDALTKENLFKHMDSVNDGGQENRSAIRIIKRLPTADVRENVKGEFIGTEFDGYADGVPVYYEWMCSKCGWVFEDDEPTYNFCPECGADMRGDKDGENQSDM